MATFSIVAIDDEELIRKSLKKVLEEKGYRVTLAASGEEGLANVRRVLPDVVLLDLRLPDADGLDLLEKIREVSPVSQVIVITAYGDVRSSVKAMKRGAFDFLKKPYELDEIVLTVEAAIKSASYRARLDLYEKKEWERYALHDMVGSSEATHAVEETVAKVARSDATTVLIEGESGTGKELVARAIHFQSTRAQAPFVEINCSSFQENLLENELFGHEKGAFTDASQQKKGLAELADGGTLFLDEVGDMPVPTQAKLLRFIDTLTFRRVGGWEDISVDIRIVAATNKDLEEKVGEGLFRGDLYYRLKVVSIYMPPLRDREGDQLEIARYYIQHFNRKFGKRFKGLSAEAEKMFLSYRWPGNIRELKNVIERTVLLEKGPLIRAEHLPREIVGPDRTRVRPDLASVQKRELETLAELEAEHVKRVLRLTEGNKSEAARILGISRQGLIEKLKKLEDVSPVLHPTRSD
ncbi:MAG: sigma-54-dependent Fis family transcriptional regulator [Candidatus Eiseniibacteriota bacterium]|nr:MAG: sigma-54-dependent Fis family transcriptional regulator [Candidatus Eisenbacteria bacterium]